MVRAAACPWDACAGPGVAGSKGSVGRGLVGPAVLGPRSLAPSDAGAESEACVGCAPSRSQGSDLTSGFQRPCCRRLPLFAMLYTSRRLSRGLGRRALGQSQPPTRGCKPLSFWTFLPDGRIRKPFVQETVDVGHDSKGAEGAHSHPPPGPPVLPGSLCDSVLGFRSRANTAQFSL